MQELENHLSGNATYRELVLSLRNPQKARLPELLYLDDPACELIERFTRCRVNRAGTSFRYCSVEIGTTWPMYPESAGSIVRGSFPCESQPFRV